MWLNGTNLNTNLSNVVLCKIQINIEVIYDMQFDAIQNCETQCNETECNSMEYKSEATVM